MQSLAVFLLYELGVFVIGFLGKVWGKLEEPLAEHIAAWLKQWTITMLSRYHRQYYRYLRYQHRDFDVKGLSTMGTYALELDQVFVELRIDPSTPQTASGSPIQVPHTLLAEKTHSLWDYLTATSLRQQHLVVIGPPGSGKTTLLKHVVLGLTAQHKLFHRRKQHPLPGKMPILLFLRDHVQSINEQADYTLVNAIQDHLTHWKQQTPPEGWFQRQLRLGRCLVMLDGLDEVADPQWQTHMHGRRSLTGLNGR
ncbi:MAG: NACHT domain-containing protein [Ktedonobacteraceae bacterium]